MVRAEKEGRAIERSQHFLNPFLRCDHPALASLACEAVEAAERDGPWRSRRRRTADLEALHMQAAIVLTNAAYALATGLEPPSVAILLGRPSGKRIARYDGPALGQIEAVIRALAPDLITVTRSRRVGTASTILPGATLRTHLGRLPNFSMASFREEGGETIVLRRVVRDARTRQRLGGEYLDYAETEETLRLRAEMERVNAALEAADIGVAASVGRAPGSRRLRRIFNGEPSAMGGRKVPPRLTLGGRLYGGWWIDWPKARRGDIRIEGQPVADLDFRNMHLRLAYAENGLEPPPGDLYAGILEAPEEDAAYRAGIKQFVNAMLSRETPLTRRPQGMHSELPKGLLAATLRAAILSRHTPIASIFETGAGLRLQRTESDLMVAVLLRLFGLGVIALPQHDGLLVRRDRADAARKVMEEVSAEVTGRVLEVKTGETIFGDPI